MYKGKRYKKSKISKLTLLVSFLLILCVAVGGTVALLHAKTNPVNNQFVPTAIATSVNDDTSVKNDGTTTAWIRAAVVVTWQNDKGEVYGVAPDVNLSIKDGWLQGADGFYYWPTPVGEDSSTDELVASCTANENAPAEGYTLKVEVVGTGIQSKPASVFNDNWKASSGLTATDTALVRQ